jgi:hypothetical protein
MKSYKHSHPPPSPLAERICRCGCDIEFQPNRKDQVYLNKQHADFGYNHNIRSKRDANKRVQSKVLANNDRILQKHFRAKKVLNVYAETYLEILLADGYNTSMYVSEDYVKGIRSFFSFNYYIQIEHGPLVKIKIFKR